MRQQEVTSPPTAPPTSIVVAMDDRTSELLSQVSPEVCPLPGVTMVTSCQHVNPVQHIHTHCGLSVLCSLCPKMYYVESVQRKFLKFTEAFILKLLSVLFDVFCSFVVMFIDTVK